MKKTSFIFLTLLALNTAQSKDYSIDQIRIRAEIFQDGSLSIEEQRSYDFRGSFNWADYRLPLDKLGRVTDFTLSEGDQRYAPSDEKTPGTFQYRQDASEFYVRWFYKADDERRTFSLRYRVEDAVTVYRDGAMFYYQFIGSDRPKAVGAADVRLRLPKAADTSLVSAWAHGPQYGRLAFDDGDILLQVSPLPRDAYWELRTIFPNEWVNEAKKVSDIAIREQVMQEEKTWVEESNRIRAEAVRQISIRKEHEKKAMQWSIIAAVIAFVAWMFFYQNYGRGHAVLFQGAVNSEIPENLPPAVANYVLNSGQLNAGAIIATLFDLARRGFVKIEERIETKRTLFWKYDSKHYDIRFIPEMYDREKNSLAAHELDMLDFLFKDFSSGRSVISLDEVKKSHTHFVKWFERWKKIVKNSWGNRPFFEKLSRWGTLYSVLTSAAVIIAGILMRIYWGKSGIIAIIAGILTFALSFAILRYTKEVKELITRLKALRTYLVKYHFTRERHLLQSNIEKYLIYGIALGITPKVIRVMFADAGGATTFPWFVVGSAGNSPAMFTESFSAFISVAGTTMSSAAGIGGGASGGGGGGAGGASGGAG